MERSRILPHPHRLAAPALGERAAPILGDQSAPHVAGEARMRPVPHPLHQPVLHRVDPAIFDMARAKSASSRIRCSQNRRCQIPASPLETCDGRRMGLYPIASRWPGVGASMGWNPIPDRTNRARCRRPVHAREHFAVNTLIP